jgi:uncharacterized protein (DUF2267 family)
MTAPKLPWEAGFSVPGIDPNLISQVQNVIEGATSVATGVGAEIAGQVAGQAAAQAVKDIGGVATVAEQIGGDVISAVVPGASTSTPPTGVPATNDWIEGIQNAAKDSAEAAYQAVLPAIQDRIAHEAEKVLAKQLGDLVTGLGTAPVATIPKGDLKKLDAWERALRTFGQGLLVTLLAVIVQVIGQLTTTHVDYFHREGWITVGTLFATSAATALVSYVMRYIKEPAGAAIDSSVSS